METAKEIFDDIVSEVIELKPIEAEFGKLLCNAYRYVEFATTNQLFMVASSLNIDYVSLLEKVKKGYPRLNIPGPGFSAGPCLMKDTMQLFASQKHNFNIGQIAMSINEGLPGFLVQKLSTNIDLSKSKIGILGMAFKGNSDDLRDSLSYRLKKDLEFAGATVLCSDEFIVDPSFHSKEFVLENADVVFVGAPHDAYKNQTPNYKEKIINIWDKKPFFDKP